MVSRKIHRIDYNGDLPSGWTTRKVNGVIHYINRTKKDKGTVHPDLSSLKLIQKSPKKEFAVVKLQKFTNVMAYSNRPIRTDIASFVLTLRTASGEVRKICMILERRNGPPLNYKWGGGAPLVFDGALVENGGVTSSFAEYSLHGDYSKMSTWISQENTPRNGNYGEPITDIVSCRGAKRKGPGSPRDEPARKRHRGSHKPTAPLQPADPNCTDPTRR